MAAAPIKTVAEPARSTSEHTTAAALKLVLDTNIALDLLFFRDPSCEALDQLLRSGGARWISTPAAHTEFLRVLDYPQLLRYSKHGERREQAAADFLVRSEQIELDLPESTRISLPRCADPDDQLFLELAVAVDADALLSKDKAVLALARRTQRFYPKLRICQPHHFFAIPPVKGRSALR